MKPKVAANGSAFLWFKGHFKTYPDVFGMPYEAY